MHAAVANNKRLETVRKNLKSEIRYYLMSRNGRALRCMSWMMQRGLRVCMKWMRVQSEAVRK